MPPRKRPQAHSTAPASAGSRRKSGRLSASGGNKSSYFEDDESADGGGSRPRKVARTRGPAKKAKEDESSEDVLQREGASDDYNGHDDDDDDDVYDDTEEPGDEDEEGEEEEVDDDDDEDESTPPPPKKRARGRPSTGGAETKATPKAKAKAKASGRGRKAKAEESEPADEYDDDDDDEDEPRVTFIPLPQLRDTDGVEYADEHLHRNTLLFLEDLKANNKRSWLKLNDAEYRRSLKDWESFVEAVTERIVDADETIPELPLKDVIFRIYRDIRFTKDPTPYKPHFSAAWSRTGRKGPYACYYVHAEPGNCMVGGGLWHPDAESLARLRASFDERPHRIRRVLADPAFRRTFLPDAVVAAGGKKAGKKGRRGAEGSGGGDGDEDPEERAVVNAFARANQEGALKTKPKGFHPDHRDIELLKLRNFTIGKKIRDEDLVGEDAQEKIMGIIEPMVPFVTFLNRTVKPDPGEDSDSEVEDGDEE